MPKDTPAKPPAAPSLTKADTRRAHKLATGTLMAPLAASPAPAPPAAEVRMSAAPLGDFRSVIERRKQAGERNA